MDYKRAAVEYPRLITPERLHHLRTKPFYNLGGVQVDRLEDVAGTFLFSAACIWALKVRSEPARGTRVTVTFLPGAA